MKKSPDPLPFIESFVALKRCLTAVGAEMYGSEGLGSTQLRFLRHVAQHPGISQAELARATETDPALTGRALQGMIDRGLLRRERSESDQRQYVLELGPKGRAAYRKTEGLRAKFEQRIVASLDARDLEDFERITAKLVGSLGAKSAEQIAAIKRAAKRAK